MTLFGLFLKIYFNQPANGFGFIFISGGGGENEGSGRAEEECLGFGRGPLR